MHVEIFLGMSITRQVEKEMVVRAHTLCMDESQKMLRGANKPGTKTMHTLLILCI